MEVLGAVASAIALAQTAISLAQALNSYAGAVSDSVDDVVVIADDISDTYGNLQQLAIVLEKNEKTKLLNEAAISNATRCVSKSEVLLRRLRKLFEKSGASESADRVESEQIDISKFRKAIWIIYKSEFELRRAELHHIKADISLIYLTYLTMASGPDEGGKQQAIDQMKLVYAKRNFLDKKLKKAQARANQDAQGQQDGDLGPMPSGQRDPEESDEYYEEGDEPAAVYATIEDLYSEFELWLREREEKKRKSQVERDAVKREGVEQYLREIAEAAEKTKSEMQKLKDALTQQGLPPQRIEQIVKSAYPDTSVSQPPSSDTSAAMKEKLQRGRPRSQRSRSSASSWFRRSRRSGSETVSNTDSAMPDLLKDPSAPGGVAVLRAMFYQRVNIAPQRYEVRKLEIGVSDFRLIPTLLDSGRPLTKGDLVSNLVQGFAELPEDYRIHIFEDLEQYQVGDRPEWSIIQVIPVKSSEKVRRFPKAQAERFIGCYVVMRKNPDSDHLLGRVKEGSQTSGHESASTEPTTRPSFAQTYDNDPFPSRRGTVESYAEHFPSRRTTVESYVDRPSAREHGNGPAFATPHLRFSQASSQPHQRRTRFSSNVEEIGGMSTRRTRSISRSRSRGGRYDSPSSSSRSRSRRRSYGPRRRGTFTEYDSDEDSYYEELEPSRSREEIIIRRDERESVPVWIRESIPQNNRAQGSYLTPEVAEKLARLKILELERSRKEAEQTAQKEAIDPETVTKLARLGLIPDESQPKKNVSPTVAEQLARLKLYEAQSKSEIRIAPTPAAKLAKPEATSLRDGEMMELRAYMEEKIALRKEIKRMKELHAQQGVLTDQDEADMRKLTDRLESIEYQLAVSEELIVAGSPPDLEEIQERTNPRRTSIEEDTLPVRRETITSEHPRRSRTRENDSLAIDLGFEKQKRRDSVAKSDFLHASYDERPYHRSTSKPKLNVAESDRRNRSILSEPGHYSSPRSRIEHPRTSRFTNNRGPARIRPLRRAETDITEVRSEVKDKMGAAKTADDGVQDLLARWTNAPGSATIGQNAAATSSSTKEDDKVISPLSKNETKTDGEMKLNEDPTQNESSATKDKSTIEKDTKAAAGPDGEAAATDSGVKQKSRLATIVSEDSEEED